MINRTGISSIKNNSSSRKKNPNISRKSGSSYITGRVTDIILNENHPDFKFHGGFNSIGLVFFEIIDKDNLGTLKYAKPLNPNSKSFPLIGEIVICFTAPTPILDNNSFNYVDNFYYINSINLWNSPHLNPSPNPRENLTTSTNQISYSQIEAGLTKNQDTPPPSLNFNSPSNPTQNTFEERSNIHPLMPFMGDALYEGRFGQSIRFGSTSKTDSLYSNNWSNSGADGEPIMIIRNGQPTKSSDEGWIPITENINSDLSSIYLSSFQKIPITLPNENFNSYLTPPTSPSQFESPQIIITSDRIILSAKKDSVLINAENSVGLSSNGSVNIDTKTFITASPDIKLGGKDATEPILLGNKTINLLSDLLDTLNNVFTVLESDQIYPGGSPAPNAPLNLIASNAKMVISNIKAQLEGTKSKISKIL